MLFCLLPVSFCLNKLSGQVGMRTGTPEAVSVLSLSLGTAHSLKLRVAECHIRWPGHATAGRFGHPLPNADTATEVFPPFHFVIMGFCCI